MIFSYDYVNEALVNILTNCATISFSERALLLRVTYRACFMHNVKQTNTFKEGDISAHVHLIRPSIYSYLKSRTSGRILRTFGILRYAIGGHPIVV